MFFRLGLKIAVADVDETKLRVIGQELIEMLGAQNVLIIPTDVSKLDQVVRLKDKVYDTWGEVRKTSQPPTNPCFIEESDFNCCLGCGFDE